jgi:hypothetical protein
MSEIMRDVLVGRTGDGSRIYVSAAIQELTREGGYQTVTHETVPTVTRVSLMGLEVEKGCRNASSGGQMLERLRDVVKPEPPFTVGDVRSLHAIWKRWHLNDTKAGCSHVPEPLWEDSSYGPRPDLKNTPACPETGYRYGHAWLVEPLPADGTGTLEGDPAAVLRFIAGRRPVTTYQGN